MADSGGTDDLMSQWYRAKAYAKARGLCQESEDFASEYILRKLKGQARKQAISQFFKDYLDLINTSKRCLSSVHSARSLRSFSDLIFTENIGRELPDFSTAGLTGRQKRVIKLYFEQGFLLKEIGLIFKVHETTICRWIKEIGYKIKAREGVSGP